MTDPQSIWHKPRNIEAEQSVLGSMLLDPDVIDDILEILKSDDFYTPSHQAIFDAAVCVYHESDLLDLTLLIDKLRKRGKLDEVGGVITVANLEQNVLSTGAAVEHAKAVAEKARIRRVMASAETALQDCASEGLSADEIAEKLKTSIDLLPTSNRWTISTVADLPEEVSPPNFLVENFIVYPSLAMLQARGGKKKSFLLMDLCVCAAKGVPWLVARPGGEGPDFPITEPFSCLWVNLDNPSRVVEERFASLRRAYNLTPEQRERIKILNHPSPTLDATNNASLKRLSNAIIETEAKLVVIDCLASIRGGIDENSSEMGDVLQHLRTITEECQCAIYLIHHESKAGGSRGSSAIEDRLDASFAIQGDESAPDEIVIKPVKVREIDVKPFGALFTYETEGRSLKESRFFGFNVKQISRGGSISDFREKLHPVLQDAGQMTQGAIVSAMLPLDYSRSQIQRHLSTMASQGQLTIIPGMNNSKIYAIPKDHPLGHSKIQKQKNV